MISEADINAPEYIYEVIFDTTERQSGRFRHAGSADDALEEFVSRMTESGMNFEVISIQNITDQLQ